MSDLDSALDRLGEAVEGLVTASQQAQPEVEGAIQLADVIAERDNLQAEVERLRALREDDARLRAEAAEAVKAALSDLRGLVASQENSTGKKAG